MSKGKTYKVKIKHKVFPYYVEQDGVRPDNTIGPINVERLARRGDEVEVSESDYHRGTRLGSFYTDGELSAQVSAEEDELDVATATVEELSAWIKEDKPTIPVVVEAADNDPELAAKLLEAENHATGNQPRAGLVEALSGVAGSTQ